MRRSVLYAATLAGLAFAACRVGPDYTEPRLDLPDRFDAASSTAVAIDDELWWRRFGDPTLDALIERAIEGNVDLAIARERVLEVRAQRDAVAGTTRPSVTGRAGATRIGPSSDSTFQRGGDYSLYEVGFDASWEIDLFGRLSSQVDAADAGVGSAIEARQDVLVSLIAEVAREYVTLRRTQGELTILRTNLATRSS